LFFFQKKIKIKNKIKKKTEAGWKTNRRGSLYKKKLEGEFVTFK
jgi:hypothetical protein